MRSESSGTVAALLIFVPLVAVPLLAVFGIPQFAPVVASPSAEGDLKFEDDIGVGDSNRTVFDERLTPFLSEPATGPDVPGAATADGTGAAWDNPFQRFEQPALYEPNDVNQQHNGPTPSGRNEVWAPPENALDGWELDSRLSQPPSPAGAQSRVRANFDDQPQRQPSGLVAAPQKDRFGFEQRPSRFVKDETVHRDRNTLAAAATGEQSVVEGPITWRSARRRLNELGIRHFQLEPGESDGFHFSCLFTPRDNPRITHRFEAEATEPLRAVQKVLAQVETWLERRSAEGLDK